MCDTAVVFHICTKVMKLITGHLSSTAKYEYVCHHAHLMRNHRQRQPRLCDTADVFHICTKVMKLLVDGYEVFGKREWLAMHLFGIPLDALLVFG